MKIHARRVIISGWWMTYGKRLIISVIKRKRNEFKFLPDVKLNYIFSIEGFLGYF